MKKVDEKKKNSKKETDEITNQEKQVKRRQNGEVTRRRKSRNRSAVQRPLNLCLKSRLCLDVIYPDYIYTWK